MRTVKRFIVIASVCALSAVNTIPSAAKAQSGSFFSWGSQEEDSKPVQAPTTTNSKKKTTKKKTSPLPWRVQCTSNGVKVNCVTSQQLFLRKTRQLLLGITVRATDKTNEGVMLIQLPHGIHIPSGLQYSVDGETTKTEAIQTCNRVGCYVGMPVKGALLSKMRQGKVLSITFKNVNKRDIKIGVPLTGFDQAFAKLSS